jgi:hypothetical protein
MVHAQEGNKMSYSTVLSLPIMPRKHKLGATKVLPERTKPESKIDRFPNIEHTLERLYRDKLEHS